MYSKLIHVDLKNDIEYYVVSEWIPFPNIPEDKEVIIRNKFDKDLNLSIIEEIIKV
jgi:hypothetical protein